MKRSLLFFIAICFCQYIYAQSEYKEGFVITLQGDTIRGYVNVSNANTCIFRQNYSDLDQVTYLPDDIQGYGFPNRFITSRTVNTNDGKEMRVFMDCLVRGDATLYQYLKSFYIEKADTLFYALYNTTSAGTNTVGSETTPKSTAGNYIGILSYLFMDCPAMRQNIPMTKYTRSSLTAIVKEYNYCKTKDFVQYESGLPSTKLEMGLFTGVNFSSLTMKTNDTNNDFMLSEPTYYSVSLILGADARISWPRGANKFAVSAGAMYLSGKYEINETVQNSIGTDVYSGTIKISELKIPLGVNYVLSNKNIKPYLSGGISMSIFLNSSSDFSRYHDDDLREDYTEEYELLQLIPMDPHLWLGLGLSTRLSDRNDGFIELRYETPSNISNSSNVTTKYTHIFLLAGIRF